MSDTDPAASTDDPGKPDPSASTDTGDATDWKAEAEKWQALSRKHEDRAKANSTAAKELEQVRQAAMSDTEKAVALAKAEGRKEALSTMGARLVDAEVKAAVSGRSVNVEALLDGLDRSRFLTDDGEPDTKAITAWVDKLAPPADTANGFRLDLGQGARGTPATGADMNSVIRRAAGRN